MLSFQPCQRVLTLESYNTKTYGDKETWVVSFSFASLLELHHRHMQPHLQKSDTFLSFSSVVLLVVGGDGDGDGDDVDDVCDACGESCLVLGSQNLSEYNLSSILSSPCSSSSSNMASIGFCCVTSPVLRSYSSDLTMR